MTETEALVEEYADLIAEYRTWLRQFEDARAKKWENRLRAEDHTEAAICEAAVWLVLRKEGCEVDPAESLSAGGPDFMCRKGRIESYVEAACITKPKATDETGLSDFPQSRVEAGFYTLMTKGFFQKVTGKTRQCSSLGAPAIVAIATLHFNASARCFRRNAVAQLLTGKTCVTIPIGLDGGTIARQIHESTRLELAAFLRPSSDPLEAMEHARSPVSALLLCGLGCNPPNVVGVLHPNPNHPLDRLLLPNIPFVRLVDGYKRGSMHTEWI